MKKIYLSMAVGSLLMMLCCAGPARAGDMEARLDSSNGSSAFSVLNSSSNQLMWVKSNGGAFITNGLTLVTLSGGATRIAIGGGDNVQVGNGANAGNFGAAVGYMASSVSYGAALGYGASGASNGVAVGYGAGGTNRGVAVGYSASGLTWGSAVGYNASADSYGVAMGYTANGGDSGAALGAGAVAPNYGSAVGYTAKGANSGAALGVVASADNFGAAVGSSSYANNTNVAIGAYSRANGIKRTAIGAFVTNGVDNSTALRGNLYLDGGSATIRYRATFGTGAWSTKAFTIDHPLDPENRVLRHFTIESPDVWNEYSGNVTLKDGRAVIELPDYYSALNLAGSEVYNLTPIGRAQVWIETKAAGNRIVIAGDRDVEVSWTVKAKRNDPACRRDLELRPADQLKSEMPEGQAGAENASMNTIAVSRL